MVEISEKLLPCPFCGGEAEIVDIEEGENKGGSCVCCTRCMASSNVEFEFKENFVSNWNRRFALTAGKPEQAVPSGWREITEEDRPPNDTDVLMGHWETWPYPRWVVECGHYGSTRGGWIHGRVTHWLPLDILPAAPAALKMEGRDG